MVQAPLTVRETEVASARRLCLLAVRTLFTNGVVWLPIKNDGSDHLVHQYTDDLELEYTLLSV